MKKLVLLLIFISGTLAHGQNIQTLSSALWTEVKDIEVSGNYAYVTFYNCFAVLDISNLSNPRMIAKIPFSAPCGNLDLYNNYAIVANHELGIQIIDISIPTSPQIVGHRPTIDKAVDVEMLGSTLYVADFEAGLTIIDLSTPTHPLWIATYNTPGEAWGVDLVGNYAYVADGDSLLIINISNPVAPTRSGALNTDGWAIAVIVQGQLPMFPIRITVCCWLILTIRPIPI